MNYSDRDMKLMAFGEIGAFVVGLTSGFMTMCVSDGYGFLFRVVGTLMASYWVTRLALAFVHWGYKPDRAG